MPFTYSSVIRAFKRPSYFSLKAFLAGLTNISKPRPSFNRNAKLLFSDFKPKNFSTVVANVHDELVVKNFVKEKDELFEIEIAAPGFTKNDFEISIENGLLKISAENSEELKKEEDNFTRREFNYNSFFRSFTLPDNGVYSGSFSGSFVGDGSKAPRIANDQSLRGPL